MAGLRQAFAPARAFLDDGGPQQDHELALLVGLAAVAEQGADSRNVARSGKLAAVRERSMAHEPAYGDDAAVAPAHDTVRLGGIARRYRLVDRLQAADVDGPVDACH